jgi:hypothetical protein
MPVALMFGIVLSAKDLQTLLDAAYVEFKVKGEENRKKSLGATDWFVRLDASAQRLAAELMERTDL